MQSDHTIEAWWVGKWGGGAGGGGGDERAEAAWLDLRKPLHLLALIRYFTVSTISIHT